MSERIVAMQAEALIGDAAEQFVKSELGRTLIGMARQEVESAVVDLDSLQDFTDKAKLNDIQLRIRQGRRFEGWLVELITRGNEALEVLRHERQTD